MKDGKLIINKSVLTNANTTKNEYIVNYNDILYTVPKKDIKKLMWAIDMGCDYYYEYKYYI